MEIQITAPNKSIEYDFGSAQVITDYLTVRNAAVGTSIETRPLIGQEYWSHAPSYDYWWKLWRGAIFIDLTSVPAGTLFGSVIIAFDKYYSPTNTSNQHLIAVDGDDVDPVGGLVVADYGELLGEDTELGRITGADWLATATPLMTLNAAGLAYLEARCGTLCAIALRGSLDIAGTYNTGGHHDVFGYDISVTTKLTVVTAIPADSMARVSSIRHICRPGFYRMQVGLGDIGFDVDVAEATVRKALDSAKEAEPPPEAEPAPPEKPKCTEGSTRGSGFNKYTCINGIWLNTPEGMVPPESGRVTAPQPQPPGIRTEPSLWERITPWKEEAGETLGGEVMERIRSYTKFMRSIISFGRRPEEK